MRNRPRRPVRSLPRLLLPVAVVVALLSPLSAEPAEDKADLLRFDNGDSLHGRFLGIENGGEVRWEHPDARDPVILESENLRRLSFTGGRPLKTLTTPAFVLLEGGDRLPGRIIELGEKEITIETEYAGPLTIPRHYVRQLAPNPHGGKLHYLGPFQDDWAIVEPKEEESEEQDPEEEQKEEDAGEGAEEEEEEEGAWVFSGGAYYSNGQLPIAVDAQIPDMARIRFTLAWRNRFTVAIAFHASLTPPEKAEKEEDPKKDDAGRAPLRRVFGAGDSSTSAYPMTYGEAYVLTIFTNYAQLHRCSFDEDGNPQTDRIPPSSTSIRLEDSGQAEFELRCDRHKGTIALFVNGAYVSQWEDARGYAGTGGHLGFACHAPNTHLRVSDVVVTAWNGMVDSAQSMEVDNRDIVLLSNGTDRYSGKVAALRDGILHLEGSYATMKIPVEEIEEVRFARKNSSELPEPDRKAVRLLFSPVGRLTLVPQQASRTKLKARHAAIGDLDLDLRYANLLEFSFSDSILDIWDDEF